MARQMYVAVLLVAWSLCCFAESAQQRNYNDAYHPNNYEKKDSYGYQQSYQSAYSSGGHGAEYTHYYSPNGHGNNLHNPDYGKAWSNLKYTGCHPLPIQAYDKAPTPREVSNVLFTAPHSQPRVTPRNTTEFGTVWAQFIDHDITHTPTGKINWDIHVPTCDRYFDAHCTGRQVIKFQRSLVSEGGGEHDHPTAVTAWIDGSQIYGSDIHVQQALRSYVGGRLRTSKTVSIHEGEWPPRVYELSYKYRRHFADTMQNEAKVLPTEKLFACGDVRCNEHPLLLSMQILFLREHNRVAGVLAHFYPHWDDETLFQKARSYVIAEIQHITFHEYLFWLLGGRAFPKPYHGYQPNVCPDIHVAFSTAAFRYGHSEINEQIKRIRRGSYGGYASSYYSSLWEHFFDSDFVTEWGIGPIFEGMASHAQSSNDNQVSSSVRNELFRGYGPRQFDLIALDIQRSRDHGLPKYNDIRAAFGLDRIPSWDKFPVLDSDLEVNGDVLLTTLKSLYAYPDDCDFFVCGLCEDWVFPTAQEKLTNLVDDYSHIGPSFTAVIVDQFARIRDGDRLWYEIPENYERLRFHGLPEIKSRLLAHIIRDNVPGCHIQDNVFVNFDLHGLSDSFKRPFAATPGDPTILSP